jgi:Domain of unknown function (DUF4177)
MQKWEYKVVLRMRGAKEANSEYKVADPWNIDIENELPKLGEEGWELVSISPRSNRFGGHHATRGITPPHHEGWDYAGFTTEEEWVFKRPKD